MTVSKTLSKILNTKFQIKLNRLLTNFVIDSGQAVSEEKQDFIFSMYEEKILLLVEETVDEITLKGQRVCCNELMSIVPDSDNLDGSIPYKHHYFCEQCGKTRVIGEEDGNK